MKRILLAGLAIFLVWLSQSQSAFAGRINSPEAALTSYLEALRDNHPDRAAAIDCVGYYPGAMTDVKSWEIKPVDDTKYEVSIDFESQKPKEAHGDWHFEVANTSAYRFAADYAMDQTVNTWAKRLNHVGKAIGLDLKDPKPLRLDDMTTVSREPFCVSFHAKKS
jgi:hypothetical protein